MGGGHKGRHTPYGPRTMAEGHKGLKHELLTTNVLDTLGQMTDGWCQTGGVDGDYLCVLAF